MANQTAVHFAVTVVADGTSAVVALDLATAPVGITLLTGAGGFLPGATAVSPTGVDQCSIGGYTLLSQSVAGSVVTATFSTALAIGSYTFEGRLLFA